MTSRIRWAAFSEGVSAFAGKVGSVGDFILSTASDGAGLSGLPDAYNAFRNGQWGRLLPFGSYYYAGKAMYDEAMAYGNNSSLTDDEKFLFMFWRNTPIFRIPLLGAEMWYNTSTSGHNFGQPLGFEGYLSNAFSIGMDAWALASIIAGPKGVCFPAGTPVHTTSGLKPIEQIAVGDRVWAYDHRRLEWVERDVLEVFQPIHHGAMVTLHVRGETIRATGGHPFWVVRGEDMPTRPLPGHIPAYVEGGKLEGRWMLAMHLREGDEFLLRDGEIAPLESVEVANAKEQVYNFKVAELENYAVGIAGILVHNTNKVTGEGAEGAPGEVPGTQNYFGDGETVTPPVTPLPETPSQPAAPPRAGRQMGDRWSSGQSATEQYEGIQEAQQIKRQRGKGESIRSIEKSRQREQNQFDKIRKLEDLDDLDE